MTLHTNHNQTAGIQAVFLAVFALFTVSAFISSVPLHAAEKPVINAEAAVLTDLETGRILYEKNPDTEIPPASLTKLMTIHIAYNFIDEGIAEKDSLVPISADADFRSLPRRSSLMFIEEGQQVTLLELLRGLALPSGNDAAIAVAEFFTGSVEEYVRLMNSEAERLGMSSTFFADASGLSELNRTTAADYSVFCTYYIESHPYALEELHMLTSYTYPEKANIPEGSKSALGPITQPNHNQLIGRYAGTDGLKTGYIDESGYNIAVTAERNGRRLLLVTLGGPGKNSSEGGLLRVIDAVDLLGYGFYGWKTFAPEFPEDSAVRIWKGKQKYIKPAAPEIPRITTEASEAGLIKLRLSYRSPLCAPVAEGEEIGKWEIVGSDNCVLESGSLKAAETAERAALPVRILDSLRLLLADLAD